MKKLLAVLLSVLLCTAGCAKEAEQTTGLFPETETAETTQAVTEAESIAAELGIEDLKQLKDRNIKGLIFGGEKLYSDAGVLLADDGRADMVGVFYVNDLAKAKEDIQNYLDDMASQYTVYSSSERFKIANAALADNGTDKICVIICDDVEAAADAAEEQVS
jgi:hypothetical protein